jgi:hypothetical protein
VDHHGQVRSGAIAAWQRSPYGALGKNYRTANGGKTRPFVICRISCPGLPKCQPQ